MGMSCQPHYRLFISKVSAMVAVVGGVGTRGVRTKKENIVGETFTHPTGRDLSDAQSAEVAAEPSVHHRGGDDTE